MSRSQEEIEAQIDLVLTSLELHHRISKVGRSALIAGVIGCAASGGDLTTAIITSILGGATDYFGRPIIADLTLQNLFIEKNNINDQ